MGWSFEMMRDETRPPSGPVHATNLTSILSSPRTYPASVTLIEQSGVVESVYLVEDGIVKLLRWEGAANRDFVVALRYPGSLLGAASVILGCSSPVTAQTLTRCRVRDARSDRFLRAIKENVTLSWQLHEIHSRYLHDQFGQVAGLKALSARTRLERLLCELCQLQAPQTTTREMRIRLSLKHSELAEALMITPQHLSRLLATLESEGLLRRERGWLVIPAPNRLNGGALSPESDPPKSP